MPTLTINGRTVSVPAGTSVLQACLQQGIEIPFPQREVRLLQAAA